jgi:hypothetical protein
LSSTTLAVELRKLLFVDNIVAVIVVVFVDLVNDLMTPDRLRLSLGP